MRFHYIKLPFFAVSLGIWLADINQFLNELYNIRSDEQKLQGRIQTTATENLLQKNGREVTIKSLNPFAS